MCSTLKLECIRDSMAKRTGPFNRHITDFGNTCCTARAREKIA